MGWSFSVFMLATGRSCSRDRQLKENVHRGSAKRAALNPHVNLGTDSNQVIGQEW